MKTLRPTLWRTCRILANPTRLNILRELLSNTEISITALATRTELPSKLASTHLRAMSARGLISSRSTGRWVLYTAQPNPSVDHANALLSTVRESYKQGMGNEEIIHYFTAFTHPRRIDIVKRLQEKEMTALELSLATQISPPALYRHLHKLINRDMVLLIKPHYTLQTPDNPLGQALLKIAIPNN